MPGSEATASPGPGCPGWGHWARSRSPAEVTRDPAMTLPCSVSGSSQHSAAVSDAVAEPGPQLPGLGLLVSP